MTPRLSNRASYNAAVVWIAYNDNAGDIDRLDPESIQHYLTVVMVADLFVSTADRVAADVVALRKQIDASRDD
jgi:hypothetical protein